MSRFFRWRYILPRLAILAALIAAAPPTLGWLVRRAVVRSGQQAVGAKVELGSARVSLASGSVTLRDLRVADPAAPMQNLFEADACQLTLDPERLLHKQAVVDHGEVFGLRFGTPRETSGALGDIQPAGAAPPEDWFDNEAAELASEWLRQLDDHIQPDLLNEFQSSRLTEELLSGWPQKYASLEQGIRQQQEEIRQLQAAVRQAQTNPLRHKEFLDSLPDRITQLEAAVDRFTAEIESMPDLAEADRRAIVAARLHDERLIRDNLAAQQIDPALLDAYLFRDHLVDPAQEVVWLLHWVRQLVPAETAPREPTNRRGRDVLFAGRRPSPDLLIRSLTLEGSTRVGGQRLELAGTLSDLASDPALHDAPVRLEVATYGSLPLKLLVTIDRTAGKVRDEFELEVDDLVVPRMLLGQTGRLRLDLSPTNAALSGHIELNEDRLTGDVLLVQRGAQITPQVDESMSRLPLARALDAALRNVDTITTRLTLGGTLDEPQCRLESDLGPTVAVALERGLNEGAEEHARELLVRSQRSVDENLARLEREMAQRLSALKPQLAQSTHMLDELAGRTTPDRISFEDLGRQLPGGSLFR